MILAVSSFPATAHETRPAIADITLAEEGVEIVIDLNIESIIAEIDVRGLRDTDLAPNAGEYDRLRALDPAKLSIAFRAYWPRMRDDITITIDGATIKPELAGLFIPDIRDHAVPRDSIITLHLPAGDVVTVQWAARFGALILRQQNAPEETAYTGLLKPGETSPPITRQGGETEGGLATFARYITVGFDHIVPKGLDHILFVLGLFLLAARLRPVLWQVTAFTAAHTVTLALGALGYVAIDPAVVEPLIAISISYVAVENIFARDLTRFRPILVFAFGLLHGLGFASVLGDFGLPEGQFIPALIGFNLGVEFGQLAVIAAAFLAVGWLRNRDWYRKAITIPASTMIAIVGLYWSVERVIG